MTEALCSNRSRMGIAMGNDLENLLRQVPLIALVRAEDPETAVRTPRALIVGGICAIEVLFRTDAALVCLKAVRQQVPQAVTGAGTVLSASQAEMAIEAGAKFVVSPGLDEDVINAARSATVPVYPGVSTATELQRAYNLGLETVKFFRPC